MSRISRFPSRPVARAPAREVASAVGLDPLASDIKFIVDTFLRPNGITEEPTWAWRPQRGRSNYDYAIDYSRVGTAWKFNNKGILVPKGQDVLRKPSDPATGEFQGALIEPQRTNLIPFSQDFENAWWTKTNATLSVVSDSRFGAYTTLTNTSDNGIHSVRRVLDLSADDRFIRYAIVRARAADRIRVRAGSTNVGPFVDFNLSTMAVTPSIADVVGDIVDLGDGYRLCWIRPLTDESYSQKGRILVSILNASGTEIYAGSGESIDLAFTQAELGAPHSSPIITTGSTVTRSADIADIDLTQGWFDPSKGTLVYVGVPRFGAEESGLIFQRSPTSGTWRRQEDQWSMRRPSSTNQTGRPIITDTSSGYTPGSLVALLYGWDSAADINRAGVNGTSASGDNDGTGEYTGSTIAVGRGTTGAQANTYNAMFYIPALLSEAQMEALGAALKAYYTA
jgi:hypothetical protein